MNITPKQNPEEFNRFLLEKVGINKFQNKFLLDYIGKVQNREQRLYDASLVNIKNDSWILILHGEMLLVYGENWQIEQLTEIKEIFKLNKYTNYLLTGNSELIYAMVDFFKVDNFNIEKERIFYRTKNINDFELNEISIELGQMVDATELSIMLKQYYHEEYNGQNDKEINEMIRRIFNQVQTNSIYVLKNAKKEICSFCTIINPDIGILFTKTEHRGNGYGKLLLAFCSKILIKENDEAFVMTDKEKIESNIVCEKVGFEPFFNYTYTQINNG